MRRLGKRPPVNNGNWTTVLGFIGGQAGNIKEVLEKRSMRYLLQALRRLRQDAASSKRCRNSGRPGI